MEFQHLTFDGPWDEAYAFIIPFTVRSKSNFRRDAKGAGSEWKKFKKFHEDVALLAGLATPSSWSKGDSDQALNKRPVVSSFIYAKSLLDTANLSKSILDACEGEVFYTDASVRGCTALSERTSKEAWAVVGFARLDSKATDREILVATSKLAEVSLDFAGI